jgi:hypothetical protein
VTKIIDLYRGKFVFAVLIRLGLIVGYLCLLRSPGGSAFFGKHVC